MKWFRRRPRCTATASRVNDERCILPDPPVHATHRLKSGYAWVDIHFAPDGSWAPRP